MKLHKWYLDFMNDDDVSGYYYIMCLNFGLFRIGASGIYHFNKTFQIRSFKFSLVKQQSNRILKLGNAHIKINRDRITLYIDHGKYKINGQWQFMNQRFLKRPIKPLFQNEHGWCDWKVIAPNANISLSVIHKNKIVLYNGYGYSDLVRLKMLPWRIPFNKLYWGRLHHGKSWIILLQLESPKGSISLYLDENNTLKAPDVNIECLYDNNHSINEFYATLIQEQKKQTMKMKVIREYESMGVLDRGIMKSVFPGSIRRFISSRGRDKKYQVESIVEGQLYQGIMEEVTWGI